MQCIAFSSKSRTARKHQAKGQKRVTSDWYNTKYLAEILQDVNLVGYFSSPGNTFSHTISLIVKYP